MSTLSIFDFNYTSKPLASLRANFWDSFQQIQTNHQILCSTILEEKSKENENDENKKILNITESLKMLVQNDIRHFYFQFLKFNFILSQPLTMGQLKKNFLNKIFPYYLFTILTKKKEINYMIIDLIDKRIHIYNKSTKLETILKEKIQIIMKENNNSLSITLKEKKNNIEINPEFKIQSELIYIIISFMMQLGDDKENSELKNYSILDDDTYIPKGFLLKTYIIKKRKKKNVGKNKRYAVLGPSQIIIFKDQSMNEIKKIIPFIPFGTQLIFDDKKMNIKLKYFNRKEKLKFLDNETYIEWKNTLKDIFNKKIVEKIDGITSYRLRQKEINSKILDEINNNIKIVMEKLVDKDNELEHAKNEIMDNKI